MEQLSKQQQIEIARLLDEVEQVNNARPIDSYKPHPKQLLFHNSEKKVRLFVGGNQTGKTTAGCAEAIWWMTGTHPFRKVPIPNVGRIIANGFETGLNQTVLPKLFDLMPKGFVKKVKRNQQGIIVYIEGVNGSRVYLMSTDQDDVAFEGSTFHWSWADEPLRKSIYDATLRGLMRHDGPMWFTMTPVNCDPWMYDEIYLPSLKDDPDNFSVLVDIMDNHVDNGGFLPDKAVQHFIKALSPEERESRAHGKFMRLSGLVLKTFDYDVNVVNDFKIPYSWPVFEGIDPHLRKPHAVGWMAVSPENEYYICNELWSDSTIPTLARQILDVRERNDYNVRRTFIDSFSETPDSNMRISTRSLLDQNGVSTTVANKKEKYSRIEHLKWLLEPQKTNFGQRPKLFIFKSCEKHIYQYSRWSYKKDSNDPEKVDDDFPDLNMYILSSQPEFSRRVKYIRAFNAYNKLKDRDSMWQNL